MRSYKTEGNEKLHGRRNGKYQNMPERRSIETRQNEDKAMFEETVA